MQGLGIQVPAATNTHTQSNRIIIGRGVFYAICAEFLVKFISQEHLKSERCYIKTITASVQLKKILACSQDELIGGKAPAVKQL
jgi:hypothetical protein